MSMRIVALVLSLLAVSPLTGDKERLRDALGDRSLVGDWVYDDLEAGIAQAKASGKPLMVVLRCVT